MTLQSIFGFSQNEEFKVWMCDIEFWTCRHGGTNDVFSSPDRSLESALVLFGG